MNFRFLANMFHRFLSDICLKSKHFRYSSANFSPNIVQFSLKTIQHSFADLVCWISLLSWDDDATRSNLCLPSYPSYYSYYSYSPSKTVKHMNTNALINYKHLYPFSFKFCKNFFTRSILFR